MQSVVIKRAQVWLYTSPGDKTCAGIKGKPLETVKNIADLKPGKLRTAVVCTGASRLP